MITDTDRTGNAEDVLYSEHVAELLGVTVHTLHKLADVNRAPAPLRKVGSRNMYLRSDVWAHIDAQAAGKVKTGPCRASQCRGTGTFGRDGLCPRHRHVVEVLGELGLRLKLPVISAGATVAEKLAANVVVDPRTGCTVWTAGRTSDGYGAVHDAGGRTVAAHRAALELAMGRPIGAGYEPDHACATRACVRVGPGHLSEVSKQENMRRMAVRMVAVRAAAAAQDGLLPATLAVAA